MTQPKLFSCLFILFSLVAADAVAETSPKGSGQLDGVFAEDLYSSPSYSIICSLEQAPTDSSTFFISDDFTDDFESVTFGYEVTGQLVIWNLRRQRVGTKSTVGTSPENPSITQDSLIPSFYDDSPYDAEVISRSARKKHGMEGELGTLRVSMDEAKQTHGYWVGSKNGWLFSVQTMPPVSWGDDPIFSQKTIEEKTVEILDACNLK